MLREATLADVASHPDIQAFYLNDAVLFYEHGGSYAVESTCPSSSKSNSCVCYTKVYAVPLVTSAEAQLARVNASGLQAHATWVVAMGDKGSFATCVSNWRSRVVYDPLDTIILPEYASTVRANPDDVPCYKEGVLQIAKEKSVSISQPLNYLRQKDPLEKLNYYTTMAKAGGGIGAFLMGGVFVILVILAGVMAASGDCAPCSCSCGCGVRDRLNRMREGCCARMATCAARIRCCLLPSPVQAAQGYTSSSAPAPACVMKCGGVSVDGDAESLDTAGINLASLGASVGSKNERSVEDVQCPGCQHTLVFRREGERDCPLCAMPFA